MPGAIISFYLGQILFDLEGGCYIGMILMDPLADLVAGRWPEGDDSTGGSDGSSSVNKKLTPKVGATGGPAQVRARYNAHLPFLSLRDGENSRSIL